MTRVKVDCPYCKGQAKLIDSKEIYGRSYGMVWFCKPCDAWVGTHKNSKKHRPLGRLANAELRHWKQIAHTKFDLLWRAPLESLSGTYSVIVTDSFEKTITATFDL